MRTSSRALAVLATMAVMVPVSPALAQTAPDITPPRLVSFDFTPQTVDVGSSGASFTVTSRWTDETGVDNASGLVVFDSDVSTQTASGFLGRVDGGTAQDVTFRGTGWTAAPPRT